MERRVTGIELACQAFEKGRENREIHEEFRKKLNEMGKGSSSRKEASSLLTAHKEHIEKERLELKRLKESSGKIQSVVGLNNYKYMYTTAYNGVQNCQSIGRSLSYFYSLFEKEAFQTFPLN